MDRMNRTSALITFDLAKRRQVLDCASPLALSEGVRPSLPPKSRAAEGCRTPRRLRENSLLL